MDTKKTRVTKARAAILAGALLAVLAGVLLAVFGRAALFQKSAERRSRTPQFVTDAIEQCPQDTLLGIGTARTSTIGLSRTVAITYAHAEIARQVDSVTRNIRNMIMKYSYLDDPAEAPTAIEDVTRTLSRATLRNAIVAGEGLDTNGAYWVVVMMPKSESAAPSFLKDRFQSDASSIPQGVKRAVTSVPADALAGIGSARGSPIQAREIARLRAHAQIVSQISTTVSSMVTDTETDNADASVDKQFTEIITRTRHLDGSTIIDHEGGSETSNDGSFETVREEYMTSSGEKKIIIQNDVILEYDDPSKLYLPGVDIVEEGAEADGVYWCVMAMSKEDVQKAMAISSKFGIPPNFVFDAQRRMNEAFAKEAEKELRIEDR